MSNEGRVIRETEWLDGAAYPDMQEFLNRVMSSAGRCVVCHAEQPHDVRWPSYAFEMEAKNGGGSSGDFEFRTCPTHEAAMDAIFERLGA